MNGKLEIVEANPAEGFYTGKPYEEDLGGYVFNYRTYSPDINRWPCQDPAGLPDGTNNYAYVTNDPTTWIDQLGLSGTLVIHSSSDGTNSSSTSGHSWIAYTPDGGAPTTTYGTWGQRSRRRWERFASEPRVRYDWGCQQVDPLGRYRRTTTHGYNSGL
jgi:RHS repeat-associated protein